MPGNTDGVEPLLRIITKDMEKLFGKQQRRLDIENPRWDQDTYWGRARHFFTVTNPKNLLLSDAELERAKEIVTKFRNGDDLPNLTEDEIWRAKQQYDSAFHPDTGEKQFLIGRMSTQVPMNVLITAFMMAFYKLYGIKHLSFFCFILSNFQVIFWQWFNQSYNAVVNYTNRSGKTEIPRNQMLAAYFAATTGGIGASLGLNRAFKHAHPLIGRWVPFFAVAAANAVNIPIVRFKELESGIPVTTNDGTEMGTSVTAARYAVTQVVFSRIIMAVPTMVGIPVIMNAFEKKGLLKKYPHASLPLNAFFCGVLLTFATPLSCAIFSQKSKIAVTSLEQPIQDKVKKMSSPPQDLIYNKGL